jgi:starch synthase
MNMRVLSTVSEAYPLAKTGGLADVAGALPAALSPHGVKVATMIPGYPAVMKAMEQSRVLYRYDDLMGCEARLVGGVAAGLDVIALDAPVLFARNGGPYAAPNGKDWPDNARRFAALGKAAADVALGLAGERFDILHAHDWQAALAAVYLRFAPGGPKPPSIVTIHNMAFQGIFPAGIFTALGLPWPAFAVEGLEYYGSVGFLKGGLWAADAITTVSPTYAEQIRTPEFGMGLEGLIETRREHVFGIVNGIDAKVWNPAVDPGLEAAYDAESLEKREINKRAVEAAFGLAQGEGPLFCVISRLTLQKGMDALANATDALAAMGGRLALLGSGDADLEAAFRAATARLTGRIGVRIGYDEKLSHLLQGGADAILLPSRFEPCGMTQLYGMRYGCVPIVARTGGLADTIIDANEAALSAGVATGFLFDTEAGDGLEGVLRRATAVFGNRAAWRTLQLQGMKADVSWARSGERYAELYRRLANSRAGA